MLRLTLMTIAILLMIFGITGLLMMPKLIQQKIEQKIQLKMGTELYQRFTNIPIPITVKVTFFNISNGQDVLSGKSKPVFQEVGPFVFKQFRRREVMDFEDSNRKIKYKEYKTYYHDTSDPHGLDLYSAHITLVNVPLLAALDKLSRLTGWKTIFHKLAERLIVDGQDKILITRPANQFLFDGYKFDFLEKAKYTAQGLSYNFKSPLHNNTFGFFYRKNNTWTKNENGEFTVYTGRHGTMDNFFQVYEWNGVKKLDVWPGDPCNQINGTDGSQFHPGVTRDKELHIFSPLVCRSLVIRYLKDTSALGIPLLRFGTPPEVFAAPRKNPKNACFCTIEPAKSGKKPLRNDNRCYIDGIMDLSACQKGAPIAASSPHFYNADPMLAMTAGLRPEKEKHETYIDIEPMTGSVFRAASRAQVNAYVDQEAMSVFDTKITGNMTPMIVPLFWIEEAASIDEKSADKFKSELLNIVVKAERAFMLAATVGFILATLVTVQCFYVTCKLEREANIQMKHSRLRKKRTKPKQSANSAQRNLRLYSASLPKKSGKLEDVAYADSKLNDVDVEIHHIEEDTEMLVDKTNATSTSHTSDTQSHDGASSSSDRHSPEIRGGGGKG